ncbi:MAG: ABC transporter ATP-binding protein [Mycoplasmatales bacterium]
MYAIEVHNVSKDYRLYKESKHIITEALFKKKKHRIHSALKDVSFKVEQGTTYGVVGRNGSGKSTVLSLINGTSFVTKGKISTNGKVSLLNVGAGIVGTLTGLENIYNKCLLSGLTDEEIEKRLDSIIEFSEIEDFIDQPVEKYSSGMKSKLGFAIAIHLQPDILIVDEALSVGDTRFSEKCKNKMNQLIEEGVTVLFVSHSAGAVRGFCAKSCWINDGELIAKGNTSNIMNLYESFMRRDITIAEAKKIVKEYSHLFYVD